MFSLKHSERIIVVIIDFPPQSGKNPCLEFFPYMLSTDQIAGFLKSYTSRMNSGMKQIFYGIKKAIGLGLT